MALLPPLERRGVPCLSKFMKKVILATNNKKIEEQIENSNKVQLICNNLQYREAILEILEEYKKVDFILISESLPGIISIEELLKKIKLINNRINIVFFLEKEDIEKEHKLRKLKIKYIYLSKKINIKNILNLIENNNENKKISNNKKNKLGKLIVVTGKRKTGKTMITSLLTKYLLEKNKKVLLININRKIEKEYLFLIRNKCNINKKLNNKNILYKYETKINDNLFLIKNFREIIEKNPYNKSLNYFKEQYSKKYDYILFDMSNATNRKMKEEIINISDKKIVLISNDLNGIRTLQEIKAKLDKSEINKIENLFIIINKYYWNNIAKSIFKSFIKEKVNVCIIYHRKKYREIYKKIIENEKINFNVSRKII